MEVRQAEPNHVVDVEVSTHASASRGKDDDHRKPAPSNGESKKVGASKAVQQCYAVVHKSFLLKTRGSLGLFALLEILLPICVLFCMYIPRLLLDSTKPGETIIPEQVFTPREIIDIRWTQSEENYCKHLYSGGDSTPTTSEPHKQIPTKFGYISNSQQLSEEIMHQALGYLVCKESSTSDFPLKNLAAFSKALPGDFLAILGLNQLNQKGVFSYMDIALACHNILLLQDKLSNANSATWPSREELLKASENDSLETVFNDLFQSADWSDALTDLRWSRSDVLSSPTSICSEECLRDSACLRLGLSDFLMPFDGIDEAVTYAAANPSELVAVVEFPAEQEPPDHYQYTIHVDASSIPALDQKYTNWAVDSVGGMGRWKDYFPFVNLQNALDQGIVKIFSGGRYRFNLEPYYSPYPQPAHEDPFSEWLSGLILPNILVFAFVPAVALQIQFIMYEKYLKLQKYTPLAQMNKVLNSATLHAVVYLPYVGLAGIASLMLSFLYPMASVSLMYTMFALWFLSLCLFDSLVSIFCSSPVLGSITVVVAYIGLWIPGLTICNVMRRGSVWWMVVSIFPPSSLYVFGIFLSHFEQLGKGLRWEHISLNIIEEENKGIVTTAGLLAVVASSALFQGLLLWINDLGSFIKSTKAPGRFWNYSKATKGGKTRADLHPENESIFIEPATVRKLPVIDIQCITKCYGQSTVLRNFSMQVYERQLTVLLGHNGAGKTTLMSILSGVKSATSGVLKIYGRELVGQKDVLQKTLGICRQADFLWPTLSVMEHVQLIRKLHGLPCERNNHETLSILEELNMQSCFSQQTMKLSGGEKRKLSLVLAFIGNPKIVVLDEPTAGMDSMSRRTVWHFLKGQIDSRTIFMTTHLMDEADHLGDRIAIMSKGELLCCGSSAYLKNTYAAGKRILVSGLTSGKDTELAEIIKTCVPSHHFPYLRSGKSVILYLSDQYKKEMALLLDSMRANSVAHRIAVSCATLNEVFLRTLQNLPSHLITNRKLEEESLPREVDLKMKATLIGLLLWKHRLNYFRNWHMPLTSVVIPFLFVLVGSLLLLLLLSGTSSHAVLLDESYIGAPSKPILLFSDGPADIQSFQDGIEDKSFGADIEQVPVNSYTEWQPYLLEQAPQISDSCGDPKQSLTCASLIFNASELSYQRDLTQEERDASSSSYQFATSDTALHGIPASLNLFNNLLLLRGYMDGTMLNKIVAKMSSIGYNEYGTMHFSGVIMNFASVSVLLAFCCLAAYFGVNPTWERTHGCRTIQLLSGVHSSRYWLGQLAFDLLLYYTFCAIVFILVYSFPARTFFWYFEAVVGLSLVLFCSGPALLHSSYLLESLFKNEFLCFGSLFASRAFLGIVFFECGTSLTLLESQGVQAASLANSILKWVFPILPEYCVARTFYDIVQTNLSGTQLSIGNFSEERSILPYLVYAVFDSVLYSGVFWVLCRGFACPTKASPKAICPSAKEADAHKLVRVTDLAFDYYRNKEGENGLRDLNFSVYEKGVLGFIGPCGAGKSTLLKLLAGVLKAHRGEILRLEKRKRSLITGYCPQSGGLFPSMTAREHMHFYCNLWSLAGQGQAHKGNQDERYLSMLGLDRYRNNRVHTLSEGNRKKLSVALALCSSSPIAVLDEPSFGVDPEGQMLLCNCIRKAAKHKSVVISSHSMSECEALCTRIGIMQNGRLASLQTMKALQRHYKEALRLELKPKFDFQESVKNFVARHFPNALLVEEDESGSGWLKYEVQADKMNSKRQFGSTFYKVNKLHEHGAIHDFRLSEMGIEDFLILGE